jgi:hypothetical protein
MKQFALKCGFFYVISNWRAGTFTNSQVVIKSEKNEIKRYKYPKTALVPWSEKVTSDDIFHASMSNFEGREVVVTEKLDGEGTSCYHDCLHARSLDSKDHPSRHWMKSIHAQMRNDVPDGWRICGENVFGLPEEVAAGLIDTGGPSAV